MVGVFVYLVLGVQGIQILARLSETLPGTPFLDMVSNHTKYLRRKYTILHTKRDKLLGMKDEDISIFVH
jgi:hypothetical protein